YRFTLDVAAVPVLKSRTNLPVLVDPSHAAGCLALVQPLALAATAAGADGLLIESHQAPEHALCDGDQAVPIARLPVWIAAVTAVARLQGRVLSTRPTDSHPSAQGWSEIAAPGR